MQSSKQTVHIYIYIYIYIYEYVLKKVALKGRPFLMLNDFVNVL